MIRTTLCALLLTCCAASLAQADPAGGAGSWHALLHDHSAPDLRGWQAPGLPAGWKIEKGVLSKDGPVDDLVTVKTYGNFELELEWKLGKAGNSGVFYRGTREYDHIYWSAPEYQLLDDANAEDGKSRSRRRAPPSHSTVRPQASYTGTTTGTRPASWSRATTSSTG